MERVDEGRARGRIVGLDLPPGVLAIFDDAAELPDVVRRELRAPSPILDALTDAQLAGYGFGDVTPLWAELEGDVIVGYRHTGARPGYLRFPLEEVGVLYDEGLSWQQILVRPIVFVWELGDREGARALSTHFAFAHFDRLAHELRTTARKSLHTHRAWYAAFVESLSTPESDLE